MNRRIHSISIVVAMASAAAITACAVPAHAKPGSSFSPARSSFSSPARVAPRPAPIPQRPAVAPRPKVIERNNTTVIRETRVIRPAAPAQASGGGFFSNMAASAVGAVGGSMLGNWLSRPSEPAPAPVQQVPVQQPQLAPAVEHAAPTCDATIYNCEKKVK